MLDWLVNPLLKLKIITVQWKKYEERIHTRADGGTPCLHGREIEGKFLEKPRRKRNDQSFEEELDLAKCRRLTGKMIRVNHKHQREISSCKRLKLLVPDSVGFQLPWFCAPKQLSVLIQWWLSGFPVFLPYVSKPGWRHLMKAWAFPGSPYDK